MLCDTLVVKEVLQAGYYSPNIERAITSSILMAILLGVALDAKCGFEIGHVRPLLPKQEAVEETKLL